MDIKVCMSALERYCMKINTVRALIVVSITIIILYTLGLFLPIIKNTKESKANYFFNSELVYKSEKKITFL